MFALSTKMMARRAPMMVRPISTRAVALVQDLETTLQNMHWADTKDTVEQIREMMEECKTNKTVHLDAGLEDEICSNMMEIQKILPQGNHNEVQHQFEGLKAMVKGKLYA